MKAPADAITVTVLPTARIISTRRRRLDPGEGMTISVGVAKGVVDPPSAADARGEWWAENASAITLGAAFLLIGGYFLVMFERVGRDPPKGPVFARYEPPADHSPAATHYIYHRGLSGHDALIASLINLAIGKRVDDRRRQEEARDHIDEGRPAVPRDEISAQRRRRLKRA